MSRRLRRMRTIDENGVSYTMEELTPLIIALTDFTAALVGVLGGARRSSSDEMIDDMIEELQNDDQIEEENSVTIPVEDIGDDAESNAKIAALNAMKPVISQIKDPVEREKACDSLRRQLSRMKNVDSRCKQRNISLRRGNDSRINISIEGIGDDIYSKYNANAPRR